MFIFIVMNRGEEKAEGAITENIIKMHENFRLRFQFLIFFLFCLRLNETLNMQS